MLEEDMIAAITALREAPRTYDLTKIMPMHNASIVIVGELETLLIIDSDLYPESDWIQ